MSRQIAAYKRKVHKEVLDNLGIIVTSRKLSTSFLKTYLYGRLDFAKGPKHKGSAYNKLRQEFQRELQRNKKANKEDNFYAELSTYDEYQELKLHNRRLLKIQSKLKWLTSKRFHGKEKSRVPSWKLGTVGFMNSCSNIISRDTRDFLMLFYELDPAVTTDGKKLFTRDEGTHQIFVTPEHPNLPVLDVAEIFYPLYNHLVEYAFEKDLRITATVKLLTQMIFDLVPVLDRIYAKHSEEIIELPAIGRSRDFLFDVINSYRQKIDQAAISKWRNKRVTELIKKLKRAAGNVYDTFRKYGVPEEDLEKVSLSDLAGELKDQAHRAQLIGTMIHDKVPKYLNMPTNCPATEMTSNPIAFDICKDGWLVGTEMRVFGTGITGDIDYLIASYNEPVAKDKKNRPSLKPFTDAAMIFDRKTVNKHEFCIVGNSKRSTSGKIVPDFKYNKIPFELDEFFYTSTHYLSDPYREESQQLEIYANLVRDTFHRRNRHVEDVEKYNGIIKGILLVDGSYNPKYIAQQENILLQSFLSNMDDSGFIKSLKTRKIFTSPNLPSVALIVIAEPTMRVPKQVQYQRSEVPIPAVTLFSTKKTGKTFRKSPELPITKYYTISSPHTSGFQSAMISSWHSVIPLVKHKYPQKKILVYDVLGMMDRFSARRFRLVDTEEKLTELGELLHETSKDPLITVKSADLVKQIPAAADFEGFEVIIIINWPYLKRRLEYESEQNRSAWLIEAITDTDSFRNSRLQNIYWVDTPVEYPQYSWLHRRTTVSPAKLVNGSFRMDGELAYVNEYYFDIPLPTKNNRSTSQRYLHPERDEYRFVLHMTPRKTSFEFVNTPILKNYSLKFHSPKNYNYLANQRAQPFVPTVTDTKNCLKLLPWLRYIPTQQQVEGQLVDDTGEITKVSFNLSEVKFERPPSDFPFEHLEVLDINGIKQEFRERKLEKQHQANDSENGKFPEVISYVYSPQMKVSYTTQYIHPLNEVESKFHRRKHEIKIKPIAKTYRPPSLRHFTAEYDIVGSDDIVKSEKKYLLKVLNAIQDPKFKKKLKYMNNARLDPRLTKFLQSFEVTINKISNYSDLVEVSIELFAFIESYNPGISGYIKKKLQALQFQIVKSLNLETENEPVIIGNWLVLLFFMATLDIPNPRLLEPLWQKYHTWIRYKQLKQELSDLPYEHVFHVKELLSQVIADIHNVRNTGFMPFNTKQADTSSLISKEATSLEMSTSTYYGKLWSIKSLGQKYSILGIGYSSGIKYIVFSGIEQPEQLRARRQWYAITEPYNNLRDDFSSKDIVSETILLFRSHMNSQYCYYLRENRPDATTQWELLGNFSLMKSTPRSLLNDYQGFVIDGVDSEITEAALFYNKETVSKIELDPLIKEIKYNDIYLYESRATLSIDPEYYQYILTVDGLEDQEFGFENLVELYGLLCDLRQNGYVETYEENTKVKFHSFNINVEGACDDLLKDYVLPLLYLGRKEFNEYREQHSLPKVKHLLDMNDGEYYKLIVDLLHLSTCKLRSNPFNLSVPILFSDLNERQKDITATKPIHDAQCLVISIDNYQSRRDVASYVRAEIIDGKIHCTAEQIVQLSRTMILNQESRYYHLKFRINEEESIKVSLENKKLFYLIKDMYPFKMYQRMAPGSFVFEPLCELYWGEYEINGFRLSVKYRDIYKKSYTFDDKEIIISSGSEPHRDAQTVDGFLELIESGVDNVQKYLENITKVKIVNVEEFCSYVLNRLAEPVREHLIACPTCMEGTQAKANSIATFTRFKVVEEKNRVVLDAYFTTDGSQSLPGDKFDISNDYSIQASLGTILVNAFDYLVVTGSIREYGVNYIQQFLISARFFIEDEEFASQIENLIKYLEVFSYISDFLDRLDEDSMFGDLTIPEIRKGYVKILSNLADKEPKCIESECKKETIFTKSVEFDSFEISFNVCGKHQSIIQDLVEIIISMKIERI